MNEKFSIESMALKIVAAIAVISLMSLFLAGCGEATNETQADTTSAESEVETSVETTEVTKTDNKVSDVDLTDATFLYSGTRIPFNLGEDAGEPLLLYGYEMNENGEVTDTAETYITISHTGTFEPSYTNDSLPVSYRLYDLNFDVTYMLRIMKDMESYSEYFTVWETREVDGGTMYIASYEENGSPTRKYNPVTCDENTSYDDWPLAYDYFVFIPVKGQPDVYICAEFITFERSEDNGFFSMDEVISALTPQPYSVYVKY